MASLITADTLARWVDILADMEASGHWCPDLAGLIASAPPGSIHDQTRNYVEPDEDAWGEPFPDLRPHPWTVDNIVRWAVLPRAELDVYERRLPDRDLGELLCDLAGRDDLDLSAETRAEVDAMVERIWELLISDDLLDAAVQSDRAEWTALQLEAIAVFGEAA